MNLNETDTNLYNKVKDGKDIKDKVIKRLLEEKAKREEKLVKSIKEVDEDVFLKRLNNEFNLWDSIEILHFVYEFKDFRVVLLCEDDPIE